MDCFETFRLIAQQASNQHAVGESRSIEVFNHGEPFEIDVLASTFDAASAEKAKYFHAATANDRYTTDYAFAGKYHDAGFSGHALTRGTQLLRV